MMRQPLVHDVGGSSGSDEYQSEEDNCPFILRYFFFWVWPSISKANRDGGLAEEDLPNLPKNDRPHKLLEAFTDRCEHVKSGVQLFFLLARMQPSVWWFSMLNGWAFLFCMACDPFFLQWLLTKVTDDEGYEYPFWSPHSPMCLVLFLSLSMLVRVACMEVCFFASVRAMNNMRTALVNALFAVVMDNKGANRTTGQWTNLMCTDADTISKSVWCVFCLSQWTFAVAYFPFCFYFLYKLVGVGVIGAVVMMIVSWFSSKTLGKFMERFTLKLQQLRDVRSQKVNMVASSMRTVKLYNKEGYWTEQILDARGRELYQLGKNLYLGAVCGALNRIIAMGVPIAIFGSYVYLQNKELDATTAFTALSWLSNIQWSIQAIPFIVNLYATFNPSLTRLMKVLCGQQAKETLSKVVADPSFAADNIDGNVPMQHMIVSSNSAHVDMSASAVSERGSICLKSATLGFTPTRDRPEDLENFQNNSASRRLSVVNENEANEEELPELSEPIEVLKVDELRIRCGELVIIAGQVGTGKSTLLESLAGSLSLLSGSLSVVGRRSFVSQVPFLMNCTLQENILFGLPMDKTKYDRVIAQSVLQPDFDMLPDKDQSKVGESGVQLSGGQRARVGFARALYADADVYFFDDVLSAVDAHTGKRLWETITLLSKQARTVILVTHQVQYISRPEVSKVVIIDNGTIKHESTWRELEGRNDIPLMEYVKNWEATPEPTATEEDVFSDGGSDISITYVDGNTGITPTECKARVEEVLSTMQGRLVDRQFITDFATRVVSEEGDERRRVGVIPWTDFKVYLNAFGRWFTLFLLLAAIVGSAICGVAGNVWLSIWTSTTYHHNHSQVWYMEIYFYIALFGALLALFQSISLTMCSLRASRIIHDMMLMSWFRAPMRFFDQTPTGRHLNRFMQDISGIDQMVPSVLLDMCTSVLGIVTQMGLVFINAPFVLVSIPLLLGPYGFVFQKIRAPSRDSRRFEAVAHTPIYSFFVDTLRGRSTIRAFGAESRFSQTFRNLTTAMARARYGNESINKWAQSLVTMTGAILYFVCGVVCVRMAANKEMEASKVGMVLFFANQLQRAMMDVCMRITTIESQFVAVERCVEYTRIYPEEIVDAPYLPQNWPARGSIEIKGLSMRYHLARPLVLRGLCLSVPSRAKVAICGRTGCGKSSLFQILTGLYNYSYGSVQIDGIELCSVPLPILRKSIRCISQQSVAVSGTLRDHFGAGVPEPFIWRALDKVGIAKAVRALPNKLDEELSEGCFSAGERQLIALAQGLLEGENGVFPKIYLFDEATASVDVVTDNQIHNVLLAMDATVLAIMHRLQHVQRFDKVVVMDKGVIVEDGPPACLMRDSDSRLYNLCKKAGIEKQRANGDELALATPGDRRSMSRSLRSMSNSRNSLTRSGSKKTPGSGQRREFVMPPGA